MGAPASRHPPDAAQSEALERERDKGKEKVHIRNGLRPSSVTASLKLKSQKEKTVRNPEGFHRRIVVITIGA